MSPTKYVSIFIFPSGGSLGGRVVAGHQPLDEYTVLAKPADSSLPSGRTETDREGSFKFEALANGTYQVEIPRRAFVQEVEVEGATSVELSVGDHSLSGQLRTGGSVLNAEVRLKGGGPDDRQLEWGLRDVIDASGNFRFDGLPSGTYIIEVSHPDYGDYSQQVEVNHDLADFDIYLEEAVLEE